MGSQWFLKYQNESKWIPMDPDESQWILMVPNKSKWIPMIQNWSEYIQSLSKFILIDPNALIETPIKKVWFIVCQPFVGLLDFSLSFTLIFNSYPLILQNTSWSYKVLSTFSKMHDLARSAPECRRKKTDFLVLVTKFAHLIAQGSPKQCPHSQRLSKLTSKFCGLSEQSGQPRKSEQSV